MLMFKLKSRQAILAKGLYFEKIYEEPISVGILDGGDSYHNVGLVKKDIQYSR